MLALIVVSAPAAVASPVTATRAFDAIPPAFFQLYTVQKRYSGLCADDPHSSTSAGVGLQQYSCNGTWVQVWGFGDDSEGYKEIASNVNTQLCIEDRGSWVGSGVPAQLWTCLGYGSMQWTLVSVPGLQNTYFIENRWNGSRCLGVNNWGVSNGDPLEVLDCNCGADQQWILDTPTV